MLESYRKSEHKLVHTERGPLAHLFFFNIFIKVWGLITTRKLKSMFELNRNINRNIKTIGMQTMRIFGSETRLAD